MDSIGYSDLLREPRPGLPPPPPGEQHRGPDYGIQHATGLLLSEVKDCPAPSSYSAFPRGGSIDYTKVARSRVKDALKKFRSFPDHACYVVLCDAGRPDAVFDFPAAVLLGAFGGGAVPRPALLTRTSNTRVSGVVVLGLRDLAEERHALAVRRVASAEGTKSSAYTDLVFSGPGAAEWLPWVTVYENPYATHPVPDDLFRGPADIRWSMAERDFAEVWRGPDARTDAPPAVRRRLS